MNDSFSPHLFTLQKLLIDAFQSSNNYFRLFYIHTFFRYFAWVMKILFFADQISKYKWKNHEKSIKTLHIYSYCIWTKLTWYLRKLISVSKNVTQLKLLVKIYVYSEMHTNTSISIVPYKVWCMHDNVQLNG